MPLKLVRNDITQMRVEAIVNAANSSLLGGGGVDGAIHAAAGPELLNECRGLGGCETGEAKVTGGYKLFAKYVIHTVGPVWEGGEAGEEELLRSCYRNSLALAREKGCGSIAFPLISAGVYGYPKAEALRVATEEIGAFLEAGEEDTKVFLVLFDREAARLGALRYPDIEEFIDDNYVGQREDSREVFSRRAIEAQDYGLFPGAGHPAEKAAKKGKPGHRKAESLLTAEETHAEYRPSACEYAVMANSSFEAQDSEDEYPVDESFSDMLLRKIDEKGMTDPQCYKKANVDRRTFSKIRSNPDYRPAKTTALAFALALELNLEETRELLMKAGFALSRSLLGDVIVEACIRTGIYNIFDVNEILFAHDQATLGSL